MPVEMLSLTSVPLDTLDSTLDRRTIKSTIIAENTDPSLVKRKGIGTVLDLHRQTMAESKMDKNKVSVHISSMSLFSLLILVLENG